MRLHGSGTSGTSRTTFSAGVAISGIPGICTGMPPRDVGTKPGIRRRLRGKGQGDGTVRGMGHLITQGMVLHKTFWIRASDRTPQAVYPADVRGGVHVPTGKPVEVGKAEKMSKSRRNVVEPDSLVRQWGADTVRLYCLSDAPPTRDFEWQDEAIRGSARLVGRVWRIATEFADVLVEPAVQQDDGAPRFPCEASPPPTTQDLRRVVHQAIRDATGELERHHFHKVIAAVMAMTRKLEQFARAHRPQLTELGPERAAFREGMVAAVSMLEPFTPHVAEEIWSQWGGETSLQQVPWPRWDPSVLAQETMKLGVQVDGKRRAEIEVPRAITEEDVRKRALEDPTVIRHIRDRAVARVVVVPGRWVIVVFER